MVSRRQARLVRRLATQLPVNHSTVARAFVARETLRKYMRGLKKLR